MKEYRPTRFLLLLLLLAFEFSGISGSQAEPELPVLKAGQSHLFLADQQWGRPLPGFSLQECRPPRESGKAQAVVWAEHKFLSPLIGRPVRLRIQLTGGTVYGFSTQDR